MSTAKVVYKWELWCLTDQKYEEVWSEDEPSVCPTDAAHTISSSPSPRIIDQVSDTIVKIKEEEILTQGYYQFNGFQSDIPAGDVGDVTILNLQWTYPITVMQGWFNASASQEGDIVSAIVAPDTVIGAIGAPVNISDNTITVSNTVLDNANIGYRLNLTDGVTLAELGRVLAKDVGNSTVTCEYGSTLAFSPLSPTYVRLNVDLINTLYINTAGRYAFAEKKVGGRGLPPGLPIVVKYQNNNGQAKKFAYNLEILY